MSDVEVVNLFGETMAFKSKKAVYQAERRKRLSQNITGDESWHGTRLGYEDYLCRCKRCREHGALSNRMRRYNLSKERALSLLSKMTCKICGTIDPGKQGWHIDHDHKCCPAKRSCGKCVRELLCARCNHLIGFANDDAEILKSAIAYLELHAA